LISVLVLLGALFESGTSLNAQLLPVSAPTSAPLDIKSDPFCAITNGVAADQGPGTQQMVSLLFKLRRESEAQPNAYLNDVLAVLYERAVLQAIQTTNLQRALNMQPLMAVQLLNAGQSEKALQAFNGFERNAQKFGEPLNANAQRQLHLFEALCYMRIGEQENCLSNHTIASCLLPISKEGVHKLPRGSRGAIDELTELLNRDENDLEAKWLLNIAYMTLGEYPEGVPGKWLIPQGIFESHYDIKHFPDVAGQVGLDLDGLAGGSVTEDFDGDGDIDLMVSSWSLKGQLRFFRNNGDGTFTERTSEAGLKGIVGGLNMMQADYNNDGFMDLLILRGAWMGAAGHQPNSLLRNNGDGTFEDVTAASGLLSFHPTQTASWFDFNGDGWIDLFIGNESSSQDVNPCELYRNNGNGTFTECAADSGVALTVFAKGVTSGDYNNDGRPDLYISVRTGGNVLLRNDGPESRESKKWKFTNVTAASGAIGPKGSFPTWFWDFNNDGLLDLMMTGYSIKGVADVAADYLGITNTAAKACLYKNNGDGTFTDVTAAMGLDKVIHAMGANFGDLDNDGWLDFYAGTGDPDLSTLIPNRMFRNAEGKYFQEVTTSGGFGHIQKGHGISFADFDNDGDQDIYEVMGGAFSGDNYRNVLFRNPGHGNHWLTLKLEGTRSNRGAIGARIRVIVDTRDGVRSIYKTVGSGASFGASPLRQEIGLGQAKSIQAVEVFWPATGKTQVIHGLLLNRFYQIREDDTSALAWNLKTFQMPSRTQPHLQQHEHEPAGLGE
jgi:hypothetical protein